MKIKIDQPVYLNEQGQRKYSEDAIFPLPDTAQTQDRLFLVCDGVGGSAKGDLAAQTVCEYFPSLIQTAPIPFQSDTQFQAAQRRLLTETLSKVEASLEEKVIQNPAYKGMATTLTYLNLTERGAVIAWIGDSRVYHFGANGMLKYVTEDHSLVSELVKRQEITPAEALTHPKKNVILRAISGTSHPSEIEFHFIPSNDISTGDFFLLCTDGILEAWPDSALSELLRKNLDLAACKTMIQQHCAQLSRDNYSMYLIRIEAYPSSRVEADTNLQTTKPTNTPKRPFQYLEKFSATQLVLSGILFLILLLAAIAIWKFT